MKNQKLQWHPGFQAGMELRLRAHKAVLTFRHELPLTKQPTVLDTLIIEKAEGVSLEDDVAAMFLRHNIIEYKNPDDAMSIDAYYKLMAYMSLYKAETGLTDAIKADEVTGTLMRQRAPEGMFRELRRLGGRIERRFPGGILHPRAGAHAHAGDRAVRAGGAGQQGAAHTDPCREHRGREGVLRRGGDVHRPG